VTRVNPYGLAYWRVILDAVTMERLGIGEWAPLDVFGVEGVIPNAFLVLLVAGFWLAPRLRDWRRLAPALGLAPERGARGLLVAPGFDPRTRAAAGALPGIALARVLALEWDGETALVLEPLAAAKPGAAPAPAGPPPGAAPETTPEPGLPGFRSGLRDEDLGLPRRPARLAPRG